MMSMQVPFVNLSAQHAPIKDELLAAVGSVLDHGQFILGVEVAEFERRFAELCQIDYAVGVNSGTDALVLALRALDIGPGDEIITVPNSFVASTGCITMLGARPVFVDVAEDYNMDPKLLESAITSKTKAILPVHLTGAPADMDPINAIAKEHGLHVVEDAAQAVTAEYNGRRVGSLSTIGCFSLHPLKTLNACGDGGVMTTDDGDLYERLVYLRNLGLKTRDDCVEWSGNSRLDTMQAAILIVKLRHLQEWTEKRRANADVYRKLLEDIPQVRTPKEQPGRRGVYHTFVIQAENRDQLQYYLSEHGVGSAIHYPVPIHMHKAAQHLGYEIGQFPVTEKQADTILSLPIYAELDYAALEHVTNSVRDFYDIH